MMMSWLDDEMIRLMVMKWLGDDKVIRWLWWDIVKILVVTISKKFETNITKLAEVVGSQTFLGLINME